METSEIDNASDAELTTPVPRPPAYLSPSSSGTFNDCQKRWEFRYIHKLADPPGEAALAGTFAHRVLELLMEEPGSARTIDRAKVIARDVWPETANDADFIALDLDDTEERRFRRTSWKAIEGLWALEEPEDVIVVSNELKVDTHLGDVPFTFVMLLPDFAHVKQRWIDMESPFADRWDWIDDEIRNRTERLGLWLDTTLLTPTETADHVVAHLVGSGR